MITTTSSSKPYYYMFKKPNSRCTQLVKKSNWRGSKYETALSWAPGFSPTNRKNILDGEVNMITKVEW